MTPQRYGGPNHRWSSDADAASGVALANPNIGTGNVDQIFVPNFESILVPLYPIPFINK